MAQRVNSPPECLRPRLDPCVGKISWRRERLPTPVFWPGEFRHLYSPWGRKELDTTERLSLTHVHLPGSFNHIFKIRRFFPLCETVGSHYYLFYTQQCM